MHWRCAYCGIWTDDSLQLIIKDKNDRKKLICCCDECKSKALLFCKYAKRMTPLFLMGVVISIIVTIGTIWLFPLLFWGLALLGLTFIVFPFATPQSVDGMGIKKSVILIRIIGLIFTAISIIAIISGFSL